MRTSRWYRPALMGVMAIVLLNTWLAAGALHTLINSQNWLAHTLEVIDNTEQLVAEVRTAESAARGYILTGSDSFEQQYRSAEGTLAGGMDHLQALTADNRSQQQHIVDLRTRVAAKLAVLEAGMAVRRGRVSGTIDADLIPAIINDTPDRFESVQATIRDIKTEEQRLLVVRTADANHARRQVWISFTVAFILDFVLLVAAYELLVRIGRDRDRIEDGLKQISVLNSELTLVNHELEVRVEERTRALELSNQELEAFSYSVSHDLRAPLRTIDGFSLALLEDFSDKLNDEGRDYIARVRAGVQRMGTLIDALLQLSRVTRTELQAEPVDLSSLATLVFNELQASDPGRKVVFSAEPSVIAQGDPRLLRIALENLIGNAWKFTSKVPEAQITFGSAPGNAASHGRTVYFIKDNGAGFDMQYVGRLFTAFQRLHGDRDFKGSGIGLATVSRIIRRHNGTLAAESAPGQGATFSFSLAA